jgi:hypothetical protein
MKKMEINDGIKLAKEIRNLIEEYPPQLAMIAINTIMDLIIDECAVHKREMCLRLSRHFLNLSKEYKNEEGKDIEAGDRESQPLREDKAKRPRVKTAQAKVRKK